MYIYNSLSFPEGKIHIATDSCFLYTLMYSTGMSFNSTEVSSRNLKIHTPSQARIDIVIFPFKSCKGSKNNKKNYVKLCMPSCIVLHKHNYSYYTVWQGKSERSDWFFLSRDFAIFFFGFRKPANSKQAWCKCHIINYLLT